MGNAGITKKPCPGCKRPGWRSIEAGVCEDCKHKLAAYDDVRKARKDILDTALAVVRMPSCANRFPAIDDVIPYEDHQRRPQVARPRHQQELAEAVGFLVMAYAIPLTESEVRAAQLDVQHEGTPNPKVPLIPGFLSRLSALQDVGTKYFRIPKAVAKAVDAYYAAAAEALEEAVREAFTEGADLLGRLAKGEVTAADFNDAVRRRTPRARER